MRIIILAFYLTFLTESILTQSLISTKQVNQFIFDIVNEKEENIDIGLWALIIAKEYDNSIDVKKYLNKLDKMAEEIKRMIAGREKDMDKFLAIKMFIYEAGEWNNYKPFSYDLDDPLGNILEHQLLSNYIDTRKGNCVSMPTLFLALMERVDPSIQFVGVKVPLHLFCRLRDRQTGDVWNVETTNRGNPARNQWYIENHRISQTALDNKLYLSDLTKKEYIGELIGTLISKERRSGSFTKALEYAELSLKLSPGSDVGLVQKGALLAEIGNQKLVEGNLTDEEITYYKTESEQFINRAFSLGWKPESKKEREEYLKSVKTELQKRNTEVE
ncbi:MAG TPA: transglutaminase family protein [Ignavibacteriaceae bacterium]|nr:transglutaminase family protein [Ignavibacteriaceae bacterium]